MILTCPACSTRYQVETYMFPPQGRDVRCAKCGHTWHQERAEWERAPQPEPEPVAFEPPPQPEPAPPPETYARPTVRDFEPQDEPAAPRMRLPAAWKTRGALGAGWIGLAVLILLLGVSAFHYRQHIVRAWPQTASLYAALGMKVSAMGLQFESYTYREDTQSGRVVLTVTGAIRNVTNSNQPVPPVRVALVDAGRRELYHWTFSPDVMTLGPGQSARFVTKLPSPPDGARELELRFARAGE
ncbi:MAG: zinc-ribbon domain-containing protein [Alphaproteobacteria bacterium]|nr:zinc-ribbon domain-containing protein [Alphaproteobacteria bacterium]